MDVPLVPFPAVLGLLTEEELLRLASRFIQAEKGRRREWRSVIIVSFSKGSGVLFRVRDGVTVANIVLEMLRLCNVPCGLAAASAVAIVEISQRESGHRDQVEISD